MYGKCFQPLLGSFSHHSGWKPQWFSGKQSTRSAGAVGDTSLIPGSALGRGSGNPLLYSCLENSVDRGAWQVTVHGVAKNLTRLSN